MKGQKIFEVTLYGRQPGSLHEQDWEFYVPSSSGLAVAIRRAVRAAKREGYTRLQEVGCRLVQELSA